MNNCNDIKFLPNFCKQDKYKPLMRRLKFDCKIRDIISKMATTDHIRFHKLMEVLHSNVCRALFK